MNVSVGALVDTNRIMVLSAQIITKHMRHSDSSKAICSAVTSRPCASELNKLIKSPPAGELLSIATCVKLLKLAGPQLEASAPRIPAEDI
jgi:hypothetical protein